MRLRHVVMVTNVEPRTYLLRSGESVDVGDKFVDFEAPCPDDGPNPVFIRLLLHGKQANLLQPGMRVRITIESPVEQPSHEWVE